MKLKEGMYVRTKDGEIFECYVGEQMGKPIYYPKNSKTNGFIYYDEICSISKDLIDLIEVGDYVNGDKVTEEMIKMRDEQGVFGLPDKHRVFIDEIKVKNIVTKEQFAFVKYEVE